MPAHLTYNTDAITVTIYHSKLGEWEENSDSIDLQVSEAFQLKANKTPVIVNSAPGNARLIVEGDGFVENVPYACKLIQSSVVIEGQVKVISRSQLECEIQEAKVTGKTGTYTLLIGIEDNE